MADELLSAEELETLLSAVAPVGADRSDADQTPATVKYERAVAASAQASRPRESILPYRRDVPPRLDDALVRTLATLHQRAAVPIAVDLAALVRREAHVKLAPLGQVTYREFAARLDNPTCFNVLSAAPLAGHWILEISPKILYPIIDCMLGGRSNRGSIVGRPLTGIELRLAARVTNLFVRHLRSAWQELIAADLSVARVACRPQTSELVNSAEMVLWIRFEVVLSGARGMINLGIPVESLQCLAAVPSGEDDPSAAEPERSDEAVANDSADATVELVAHLARSRIERDEVDNLAVGDTITTEQPLDGPLDVLQDGVIKFRARAGAVEGRKALKIEQVLPRPTDASPEKP